MMASVLSLQLVRRVCIVMIGLVLCTEVVSPLTLSLKGKLATHCDQSNTIPDLVIGLGAGLYAVCLYLFDMNVLAWCILSHCVGCYMLPIYYLYIMVRCSYKQCWMCCLFFNGLLTWSSRHKLVFLCKSRGWKEIAYETLNWLHVEVFVSCSHFFVYVMTKKWLAVNEGRLCILHYTQNIIPICVLDPSIVFLHYKWTLSYMPHSTSFFKKG